MMCYIQARIRLSLICFCVIFLLLGVTLISTGILYNAIFSLFDHIIPETYYYKFSTISKLLIGNGTALLICTVFGFAGIFYKNQCFVLAYSIVLVVIVLFQISLASFTLSTIQNKTDLRYKINEELDTMFRTNDSLIHVIQTEWYCCGTYGPLFWNETVNKPFPESCFDGYGMKTNGCCNGACEFFYHHVSIISFELFGYVVPEILGLVLAIYIWYSYPNYKKLVTERDDSYVFIGQWQATNV